MTQPGRFSSWFFQRLAPNLLTLALLAGAAAVMASSFSTAAWVPDSTPLINALWAAALLGTLLAASRFKGWQAAAYHALLALLLLCLWIGKVVPPLNQMLAQPILATLDLANIRLFSFTDRLSSWVAALLANNNVQDNGLFQLLIGLTLWAASAWLAWAVIRRQRALDGLLPAGLVLGLNIYLDDQPVDSLWLFLGCALLLMARTTIIGLFRSWDRRRVDYPDELSWTWTGSALALGLIILFAARLSPVFGTPEGWRTLGDFFRNAQKRLEDTTTRLFGDVAPPPPHLEDQIFTPEPPAAQAITPEMGLIGAAPPQSNDLVMWVLTSDPPPLEPLPGQPIEAIEPGPIHYWRSAVFGRYTGAGWDGLPVVARPPGGYALLPLPAPTAQGQTPVKSTVPGRYLLTQTFEIAARHSEDLFAASIPAGISSASPLRSPLGGSSPPQGGGVGGGASLRFAGPDGTPLAYGIGVSQYTVQSWVTQATDVMLRAAPTTYPAEIAGTFLQLPSSLPQRIRDLARRVVGDAATPFDKAVRIQDYLRLSYRYDLGVPLPPAGRDVVDYFLFDSPGGFCSYYSSAMAVMLRSQGVAARVASGYTIGGFDFNRGAYRVTPSNAHAWVEVFFSGYGWIEFEPTAGLERIKYETPAGLGTSINEPLPERPIPPAPAWQGIALASVAVATPILLFILVFWLRARRRRLVHSQPPERQAELDYLRLRRILSLAGLKASASTTPSEYLQASAPVLTGRGRLPSILAQATQLYQQAAFSPRPPSYAEVDQAHQQAGRGWSDFGRLFVSILWQRLVAPVGGQRLVAPRASKHP